MRTIVKGKNLDVSDADRRYVEQKMRRVERLLDDRSDATVELSVEAHKSGAESHIVEVTLVIDGQPIRGEGRASTHRAAVDEVVDKLERRAVDHKERPRERSRSGARHEPAEVAGRVPSDDVPPRIVKVKRFAIEPMFEEDALVRMGELEHSFFVFVNAESERVAVLYRRRDGDFGLIEPTVGGSYASGQVSSGRSR